MEWLKCKLKTTTEATETVGNLLIENGVQGFQIEDKLDLENFLKSDEAKNWDYVDEQLLENTDEQCTLTFYLSQNAYGREIFVAVQSSLEQLKLMDLGINLGTLELIAEDVNDEDWINNWKKYYKPLKIGRNVVVKPLWEEYTPKDGEVIFKIEPGHVFGTGLHHTTQLCVQQLENYVTDKKSVLDLGCGSGILSIISLLLGAKNAFAVDIDKNAVKISYENAELNDIGKDKYTVKSGDVLSDTNLINEVCEKQYDVVVANIVADVIIAIKDFVKKAMKDDGVFISSGIIEERAEEVAEALKSIGFIVKEINYKEGWASIVAVKGE